MDRNNALRVDRLIKEDDKQHAYIVLRPRDLWASFFVNAAKKEYRNRNAN